MNEQTSSTEARPQAQAASPTPPIRRHRSLTDACADTLADMARAHSTKLTSSTWFRNLVATMFAKLDTDGDGVLSLLETTVGLYQLYFAINQKLRARIQTPSRKTIDQLFESVDADKNRQLDEHEFYHLCVVVTSKVTRDLLRAFLRDIVVLPLAIYALKKLLVRLRSRSPLLELAHAVLSLVPAIVVVPLTRTCTTATLGLLAVV